MMKLQAQRSIQKKRNNHKLQAAVGRSHASPHRLFALHLLLALSPNIDRLASRGDRMGRAIRTARHRLIERK